MRSLILYMRSPTLIFKLEIVSSNFSVFSFASCYWRLYYPFNSLNYYSFSSNCSSSSSFFSCNSFFSSSIISPNSFAETSSSLMLSKLIIYSCKAVDLLVSTYNSPSNSITLILNSKDSSESSLFYSLLLFITSSCSASLLYS